jgi:hypothetical protein
MAKTAEKVVKKEPKGETGSGRYDEDSIKTLD